jgi:hypothetical protein
MEILGNYALKDSFEFSLLFLFTKLSSWRDNVFCVLPEMKNEECAVINNIVGGNQTHSVDSAV